MDVRATNCMSLFVSPVAIFFHLDEGFMLFSSPHANQIGIGISKYQRGVELIIFAH
jgi:hypothetical protein